jgi:hypothetical protein
LPFRAATTLSFRPKRQRRAGTSRGMKLAWLRPILLEVPGSGSARPGTTKVRAGRERKIRTEAEPGTSRGAVSAHEFPHPSWPASCRPSTSCLRKVVFATRSGHRSREGEAMSCVHPPFRHCRVQPDNPCHCGAEALPAELTLCTPNPLIPAKAGIQSRGRERKTWIPACAGMSGRCDADAPPARRAPRRS